VTKPSGWLTKRQVAQLRGVQINSVSRYLATSRRRLRDNLPLRPMDIPIPRTVGPPGREWPEWDPDGPIAAWLAYGARNKQRRTKETQA
jgi:hypothetical protein